jgi:type VI secretion system protein VasJ
MLQKYLSVWHEGVGEDGRYGTDVSFEPDFEELRREVEKDTSIHGGAATDWEHVLRLATHILQTQSKDIWALCYAIRAAYALEGARGCVLALVEANRLFIDHWDGLYPSVARLQRRAAPFLWLASRLEGLFPVESMPSVAPDDRAQLKEALEKLQAFLDEKFEDDGPSFSAVIRALPEKKKDDSKKAAQVGSADAPAQHGAPPSAHVTATELLKAIDSDGRVPEAILPQLLRTTQDQTQQLGAHYLACDSTDWRVILLHRAGLWGTINQVPPADASGVTQARSIPLDKVTAYTAAIDNRQYAVILPQLERSASKAPFWLDGHCLVARCLEALGAKDAHRILCGIFIQFVRRFPGLTECKFHDGTPFANERTKLFLSQLAVALDGENDNAALTFDSTAVERNDAPDPLNEALRLLSEQDFEAGLRSLGSVPAGKTRAAVRHALLRARYCLSAGRRSAAIHLLKALYSQLDSWALLDWEPELTASIIFCLSAASQSPKEKLAHDVLGQLHWLHLETALRILKE